ncbi:MAG: alpha-hydroxy-acid oxidizing protein [Solirubrobacterales bacterium]
MPNYGDFQLEIYLGGLTGQTPDHPMTYDELERRAEEALSTEIFSYVAGGAGNEHTQRANVSAFDGYALMPRMLSGAAERDLSVELFGLELPTPLLFAPVGVIGLCDTDGHGDQVTARASAATGVPMIASTLTMDPMEDVAPLAGETPGFFQLYTPADRELAASFVKRAEIAGYKGIVVTLDTQILGWRPRDLALASFPQLKGQCLENYFSDPVFTDKLDKSPEEDPIAAAIAWALGFSDAGLSWDDLEWLRSLTDLPLLLKGICSTDDVRKAVDGGVDGIYCSNHGGRQANGGLAAIDILPEVVEAAGDVPVIFDSGVRSGEHVVKALALGARAVAIGRPYAYALAAGGEAGIVHLVRSLLAETDLLMAVDGYKSIAELTPAAIRRV